MSDKAKNEPGIVGYLLILLIFAGIALPALA
jgi:hypothetical protein